MYVDPPAPRPLQPGEDGPAPRSDPTVVWTFNPEYHRLVVLWQQVMPLLDELTASLDKALRAAKSQDTWDAPVAERYVQDMDEWHGRLARYRLAVLTAISDEAADTPRWVERKAELNAQTPYS
ncbi:hypothetical protein [Sinosporangium siamense]|uniref:Uncharacterized protein n=1 Tax=Sinosporangium siamense TaxID=1367973 RepID=A0A919V573_9ACTN|nr:hypothetical protein [Sinosporangium siamense]GII91263.1 hypothetical protein Ssi02_14940 [Sinosporangium siamense]